MRPIAFSLLGTARWQSARTLLLQTANLTTHGLFLNLDSRLIPTLIALAEMKSPQSTSKNRRSRSSSIRIFFLSWVLAGALAFFSGCSSAPQSAGASAASPSKPSPKIADLDGRFFNPFQTSQSGSLVFIFLRTDCPVSNRYAPEISRIEKKFGPRGVRFLLVYPDPDETPATIRNHLKEYSYTIAAARDPRHDLVKFTGVHVTPEAAVFRDRVEVYRGRIDNRYVDFGKDRTEATERDLESVLEKIVQGEPVAFSSRPAIGCYIPEIK